VKEEVVTSRKDAHLRLEALYGGISNGVKEDCFSYFFGLEKIPPPSKLTICGTEYVILTMYEHLSEV
jgi:hypothetical protein